MAFFSSRSLRKKFRYLTGAKTVTIDGVRLVSDKRRVPQYVRDLMYREVYEDTERNVLLRILKRGSVVVELGTGVGFISLLAAKICGPSNVHTYEANPRVMDLIRENYTLNKLEPNLHMQAVTADGKAISFNSSDNIISSSAFERGLPGKVVTVDAVAFADVLERHQPDVLIMDIEGGEFDLLTGSIPHAVKHILVELHPHIIGGDKVATIKSALAESGFSVGDNDRKTFHFYRG